MTGGSRLQALRADNYRQDRWNADAVSWINYTDWVH